jgi:predicted TIM-barrel fold metal-dependent hydrolase
MICTRRDFARTVGVAAGAGVLVGQKPPATRIDVHHHLCPPEYRKAVEPRAIPGIVWPAWSPEQSVQEMDRNGVAASMLSLSPPGIWYGDVQQGRALSRIVNEYGARMVHDFPGRFGLFAALPLPDIEGSLREIAWAFDTLKAEGIGLFTSYGNAWLGDPAFAPVWEELNRRKAVVYTHPNIPACCGSLIPDVGPGTVEYSTDTTRTIASLVFSGTAARYPDIRWIFSHGGGTMPFLISRFGRQGEQLKDRAQRLPNGVMYELRKFYYDIAQANHPAALNALLQLVPPAQILFGSDYPYRPESEVVAGLAAHKFAAAGLRAINRDNLLRLIPQLRA